MYSGPFLKILVKFFVIALMVILPLQTSASLTNSFEISDVGQGLNDNVNIQIANVSAVFSNILCFVNPIFSIFGPTPSECQKNIPESSISNEVNTSKTPSTSAASSSVSSSTFYAQQTSTTTTPGSNNSALTSSNSSNPSPRSVAVNNSTNSMPLAPSKTYNLAGYVTQREFQSQVSILNDAIRNLRISNTTVYGGGGSYSIPPPDTANTGYVSQQISNLQSSIVQSQWSTSGSNIYYSTGNVGIGSSTPGSALSVNGTTSITQALIINGYPIQSLVSESLFAGINAGSGATSAVNSSFLGEGAGYQAVSAYNGNFMGYWAGYQATSAFNSNFMGQFSGQAATGANNSNFLGTYAGKDASGAADSNFIGYQAGNGAISASRSNFIGSNAGLNAASSSNSIFIGRSAGLNDTVDNTTGSKSSILIGNYTSTGGFSNSIAIGQGTKNSAVDQLNLGSVIFATGISSTTSATSTPTSGGRVGIGSSTPIATLSVKGTGGVNPFVVASSTGTQLFTILQNGNVNISGLVQDASNASSTDFNNRKIYASGGTVVQIDYSLTKSISMAGAGTPVSQSLFFGHEAGVGASSAGNSNFFGGDAGYLATNASDSNFFGPHAGGSASSANNSNFIGSLAGNSAVNAYNSNFIGNNAGSASLGLAATYANNSNFIGTYAGSDATNAYKSNFIGYYAGSGFGGQSESDASQANNSNFIGTYAGANATYASSSNFIGYQAGSGATTSAKSIFIGLNSGLSDTVDNTSGNKSSILIGNYTSTGGFSNSIAIGQGTKNSAVDQLNLGSVIFATGISSTTSATSTPTSGGRVGIGSSTPIATLSVMGKGGTDPFVVASSSGPPLFQITSGGNIGIGAPYSLSARLHMTSPSQADQLVLQKWDFPDADYNLNLKQVVTPGTVRYVFDQINNGTTYSNVLSFMNGKIGIGVASPVAQLDVYGLAGSSDIFAVSSSSNARIFTIAPTGNLGISTSTPAFNLSVVGTVGFDGLTAASGTSPSALCLTGSKEVVINSGAQTCSVSSLRFKHNIQILDSGLGLDFINALRPVSFEYNDGNKKAIGFIAEDVNLLDTRLVFYEEDGVTPRGVNYEQFAPIFTKAIQELDKNVGSLASPNSEITDSSGGKTFVGRFFDRIISWFANAANGIGDIFANRVRTKTLCIGDDSGETCINKSQLDKLLQNSENISSPVAPVANVLGATTPGGDSSANATSDATSSSTTSSTTDAVGVSVDSASTEEVTVLDSVTISDPLPTPTPETAPSPEPLPSPEPISTSPASGETTSSPTL